MIGTRRAVLLVPQQIRYLLKATFSQDIAAPLPASLPVDVGGPLTVVDTNSIMSQGGGRCIVNGTAAAISNVYGPSFARQAGRAFLLSFPNRAAMGAVGGSTRLGWGSSPTDVNLDIGLDTFSTGLSYRLKIVSSVIDSLTFASGEHQYGFVQRGTGGLLLFRVENTGPYSLLWVYNTGTGALYPKLFLAATTYNFSLDNVRVLDLGAIDSRFATDEGLAVARIASNSAGDTIAHTADGWIEQTLTAATGVDKDIYVRWTDDSNCWIVRQNQGGSTVKLIEKVAGVETSRGSVATTYTNGTGYRHIAICEGSVIKVYVDTTLKITYSSASFQATATTAKAPSTGAEFKSYPRTITLNGAI